MNRRVVLAVALLLLSIVAVQRTYVLATFAPANHIVVGMVYDPRYLATESDLLAAYRAFFEENGIPFAMVASTDIALKRPEELMATFPALVFGDGVDAWVPSGTPQLMRRYAALGGNVALIDDVGTRVRSGQFLGRGATAELLGLDYERYSVSPQKSLFHGSFRFSDSAAVNRWGVPLGKLTPKLEIASYQYGALIYPFAKAVVIAPDLRIDAWSGNSPVLATRRIGSGNVLWTGLPLGYLKGHSDAFAMQLILQQFLVHTAQVPHLVPAPGGIGRLIINLHLDSNAEWQSIPHLFAARLVRKTIPMEFDATAGPDRDREGDHEGLDACGLGTPLIRELAGYGTIGSHGGWAHNYFAWGVEDGTLAKRRISDLIKRNNDCITSITGKPIRSFAAPDGAQPQPLMTNILGQLGMNSYYYTGDTGMSVTRAFYDGRMVSSSVWAFPTMPYDRVASLHEMAVAKTQPKAVLDWLDSSAAYAARTRSIMLLYSHAYDLFVNEQFDASFSSFLDTVEHLEKSGQLLTGGMAQSASFMQRFVATYVTFSRTLDGISVHLANGQGLRDIAFAVPFGYAPQPRAPWLAYRGVDQTAGVFAITDDRKTADISFFLSSTMERNNSNGNHPGL
jgi:peptidoglycan/xylan/chitin deacetylase (PgdA/CDA1 family)